MYHKHPIKWELHFREGTNTEKTLEMTVSLMSNKQQIKYSGY